MNDVMPGTASILSGKKSSKQERIDKVVAILKEHDMELTVQACGCCDSPWVTFTYKGEEILNEGYANI